MRIIITGHTSGIGLALFNQFTQLGHEVKGFSRSTGHDIGLESVRNEILAESFDLFVNNAYHNVGQNKLLETLLNQDKSVINISSNIVNFQQVPPEAQEYKLVKQSANELVNNYAGPARVLNVLPDLVKTNFYLGGELLQYGMDPNYVAELIIKEFDQLTRELVIKHPSWSQ